MEVKQASGFGIVYKDGSFKAPNGNVFTKVEMKELIREYKGVNRIHKPVSLLFYTDVMNGKNVWWAEQTP